MTLTSARGFGLVESMVAIALLAIGLLAVAAGFAQGLRTLAGAQLDILAREKAAEAIESTYTARDTQIISWDEVRNVLGESGADGGIFLDGPQPLTDAGADGLVNTIDDGDVETILMPGPDGLLGTDDDIEQRLTSFTREIELRDLSPTLRQLRVTIRYIVGNQAREYVITTYISSYA